jgi:hemerythrin
MSRIDWDDSLSIGVELIDDEHKMLIQKLRDLSEAFDRGMEKNKILKTLDFLIDYTEFHFTDEERVMKQADYPGLEEQKQQHEEFRQTLNHILEDYQDEGPTKSLAESVNVFLVNWLFGHIKGSDLKLGKFLREKGLAEID